MNTWPGARFPTKPLRRLVSLSRSRREKVDGVPYIGLEDIESLTGRLANDPTSGAGCQERYGTMGNGFDTGDVLFGKLRPYLAKAWVAEFSGVATTEALVMRPHTVDARFLKFVCLSSPFLRAVDASTFGSKMPRAEWDFIGAMPIPMPEPKTQHAIALYLERQTEQLDILLAEKTCLLRLLEEKRRAIITDAVTGGIDSGVALRDSDNALFGKIPEGWLMKPLGAVADCLASNVDKHSVEGERPVRLCNYTNVYNNEYVHPRMDLMRATASEGEISRFGLRVNDVVITKDSETWEDIGVPALVTETAEDFVCGYHLALLRPNADAIGGRFLLRLLQARPVQVQFELAARGMTRFGLLISDIMKTLLPVPPLPVQSTIADYLDRETARLDALRETSVRTIGLLNERRTALISAALTGEIDVGSKGSVSR